MTEDQILSSLDLNPNDVLSSFTSEILHSGSFMFVAFVFAGMIAQPLFVILADHIRVENPLKGKGGGAYVFAAFGVLVFSLFAAGRIGYVQHYVSHKVIDRVAILTLGRDQCVLGKDYTCVAHWRDGTEIWIHRWDLDPAKRGRQPGPLARPDGLVPPAAPDAEIDVALSQ